MSVSGPLSSCACAAVKEGLFSPVFLKGGLCFKRLGSNNVGGYLYCPDLFMTQKWFPVLSRRVPVFCAPHVGWGWQGGEVTKDLRWRTAASAGSLGKVVKDDYCPMLPHLFWPRCS